MANNVRTSQMRGFIEDDFGGASPEALIPASTAPVTTVAYDSFGQGAHWQCVLQNNVNTWVRIGSGGGGPITIAIVNRLQGVLNPNTLQPALTDEQCRVMAEIVDIQLQRDFAPAWPDLRPARCRFLSASEEPELATNPNLWPIYMVKGLLSGAGGLHNIENSFLNTFIVDGDGAPIPQPYTMPGRPVGYVAAVRYYYPPLAITPGPTFVYPPDPYHNYNDPLVPVATYLASTIAIVGHEAMEMLGDPTIDTWANAPPFGFCQAVQVNYNDILLTAEGAPFVATHALRETVDPVQHDTYPIGPVQGITADCTNFTTANWWRLDYYYSLMSQFGIDPSLTPVIPSVAFAFQDPYGTPPPPGTKYDFMGLTSAPFEPTGFGAVTFIVLGTTARGLPIVDPDYVNPKLFAAPYTPSTINEMPVCPSPPPDNVMLSPPGPDVPVFPMPPGEVRVEMPIGSFGLYLFPGSYIAAVAPVSAARTPAARTPAGVARTHVHGGGDSPDVADHPHEQFSAQLCSLVRADINGTSERTVIALKPLRFNIGKLNTLNATRTAT